MSSVKLYKLIQKHVADMNALAMKLGNDERSKEDTLERIATITNTFMGDIGQ